LKIEINKALATLKQGGIILYPTDTIWGIGCDSTNSDAIAKIFKLKRRSDSKALISLVANKEQLESITETTPDLDITSNPTTIVYPNVKGLNQNLLAENGSAAIRIVQDEFCQKLILSFGKAIVSTSANISGKIAPKQFSEISKEIKNNVDYIVNLRQNELMSTPSSILIINENTSITKIR
jgi:L-threonylcarbamoyladenylate synthase